MGSTQAEDAQRLYDNRGPKYDDSHHPRFARHMVELIQPQPGEHILDLACGTGLVSYPASTVVGCSGSVTGVDISRGMLAEAETKRSSHSPPNVTFHRHSITELDSLAALRGRQFDVITCCSALVLFPNPSDVLKHWVPYLKPGGRLIVDVTHPQNLTSGIVCEKVGNILARPVPWYRLNFTRPEDLQTIMETAGLHRVKIILMSQLGEGYDRLEDCIRPSFDHPKIHQEHEISDADSIFEKMAATEPLKPLASPPDVREKARVVFRDEWRKAANEAGKVQEIDGIFMGIGYKK